MTLLTLKILFKTFPYVNGMHTHVMSFRKTNANQLKVYRYQQSACLQGQALSLRMTPLQRDYSLIGSFNAKRGISTTLQIVLH